jgi:TonB-dependent SusC/RagA subfamily outer membrane receptor
MRRILLLLISIAAISQIRAGYTVSDSVFSETKDTTVFDLDLLDYKQFNKGLVFSPLQLLQGNIPGLTIAGTNGNDPNPEYRIQLRGVSTLHLGTSGYGVVPLFIVDGIPVINIEVISLNSIESIRVLKDISETAEYGVQGTNGVVLITTKKTEKADLSVKYSGLSYLESFASESGYMNADEYVDFNRKLYPNSTYTKMGDTDWRKEISQTKLSHAHNISFSGKVFDNTEVLVGVGYRNSNGILQKTDSEKFDTYFNLSQNLISDRLKLDISLHNSKKDYQIANRVYIIDGYDGILSYANRYNPTVPSSGGDYAWSKHTPLEELDKMNYKGDYNNTIVNARLTYYFNPYLKSESVFGKQYFDKGDDYEAERVVFSDFGGSYPLKSSDRIVSYITSGSFSQRFLYARQLTNHYINARLATKGRVIESEETINDDNKVKDDSYNYYSASLFADYSFKNRYFISLGFLKQWYTNNQKGKKSSYDYNLPSVKLGWLISDESFMDGFSIIDYMKLTTGYGSSKQVYGANIYKYKPELYVYKELPTETLTEYTFGADISFANRRLDMSVNYFNRRTKNITIIRCVDYKAGDYYSNLGVNSNFDLNNAGVEIGISAKPVIEPFKWNVRLNLAINNSSISKSDGDDDVLLKHLNNPADIYKRKFQGYRNDGGIYLSNENTKTGSGIPDYTIGVSNTFKYKNLSLDISARGAFGFDIYNNNRVIYSSQGNHIKGTNIKDIYNIDILRETDMYVEKGDYLKIDNITLSYNIPVNKRYIENLQVYASCINAFTFTSFTGDPEMSGFDGYYDNFIYPHTRMFMLGCSITL